MRLSGKLKYLNALLFLILLMAVSGCSKDSETTVAESTERVVLAYLAGDNSLSGEAMQKLEAMRAGWNANIHGRLIVYIDTDDDVPKLEEITADANGVGQIKELHRYPEQDAANKNVLAAVISEVKDRYRAGSYGLLVFSHGSAWLPYGALTMSRSAINDSRKEMELADLKAAIPDHAFDYIIFEACYMASIEVAYELKDKTQYLLASSAEIVSPGFTSLYKNRPELLFDNDISGFARAAFDLYKDRNTGNSGATLSLIKTEGLSPLAGFIHQHAANLPVSAGDVQEFTRMAPPLIFDFEDYYSRLMRTEADKAALTLLVNACVVWKASTSAFLSYQGGFDIIRHSGLTTYIPAKNRYLNITDAYQHTDWYLATKQ